MNIEWTLIRYTSVWIIRRMNTATTIVTIMSVHLSRREAIEHLRSIKESGYSKEVNYKFVIMRERKRVESTIWTEEV